MMKALIATTLIATSAHAELCTFESLPSPTQNDPYYESFFQDPVYSYEGFHFSSSYALSGNTWWYYDIVGGSGFGGYDEGIVGDRAIYTPYGSSSSFDYRIGRNGLWGIYSLEVTTAWHPTNLVIQGFRNDDVVFTYNALLQNQQRTKLNIFPVYPVSQNLITEIKVFTIGLPTNLIIDNIEYMVSIPAPSALALIGVAGLVGVRRRR